MILVDTSVWVDHLRHANASLAAHLHDGRVACHPFVIGELALGALRHRSELLRYLELLPQLNAASHDEVLTLVEKRRIHGAGIGWVDAHLLAAVLIARVRFWTLDVRLAAVARQLGIRLAP